MPSFQRQTSGWQGNIPFFSLAANAVIRCGRPALRPAKRFARAAGMVFATSTADAASASTSGSSAHLGGFDKFVGNADHSWMKQLSPDPETEKYAPNRKSREVRSGHYVKVRPVPLPEPTLVIHSPAMATTLGFEEDVITSEQFVSFFSGDQDQGEGLESWATPYALSIMGTPQSQNCPFGNGNGYGDGRAISIGEVVVDGQRWELQLKGGGPTPFCRGGDGRAVLRSSIREFLASEAMHNLGVPTTRALSLIVSGKETSRRPWYSERAQKGVAAEDFANDPRLKQFPKEMHQMLIRQLQQQGRDPDIMIIEPCAITTRVSPSFLRVGHLDLFARRVANNSGDAPLRREQLRQIVEHALFREFPDIAPEGKFEERVAAMLGECSKRIATLMAEWLRIGFCQGNFNADNCLVAGRTMDYGPFGWMDEYDPLFAKWVGSGEHYAYANQPGAGLANFQTLALALVPLLGSTPTQQQEVLETAVSKAVNEMKMAVAGVYHSKLGFDGEGGTAEAAANLWKTLEPLMRSSRADFILLWRQLAEVATLSTSASDDELLEPLRDAFYAPPKKEAWGAWLREWLAALEAAGCKEGASERMKAVNPKYVPREWMLVEAYDAASGGDYSVVHDLHTLFLKPYDEQPDFSEKYYRRAPDAALNRGGTAFMS